MNINQVALTGNLTRDPELRHTGSGVAVCSLRIASNTRRKNQSTGEWEPKANFFDVTVWGKQGENCAQYLAKGRPIALSGRLEWREWEAQDGSKRQGVEIVADDVQFLGDAQTQGQASQSKPPLHEGEATPPAQQNFDPVSQTTAPASTPPSAPHYADDDIPF